jgi:hypothetical protein
MILPLPEKFDENEWLIIATLVGGIFLYKLLPKRFPTSMTLLIVLFSSFYARTLDHILASPLMDFYDVMDSPAYELFGVFSYFMYSPFAYLFIYLYDKFNIQGMKTALYVFGFSVVGIGYEWIAVKLGVFTYKEWEFAYSFTVYLFVQYTTILFFEYIKRNYHKKFGVEN